MRNNPDILRHFENSASPWLAEAEDRIRQHRMGAMTVKFIDAAGHPLSGVNVRVSQKTHEFDFGANIFMLDEMESEEKNRIYKERFAALFNTATLPFYWEDVEPEKGQTRYEIGSPRIYRRPPVELCLEFCEKNSIKPREHGLAFDACFPLWLRGLSVDEVKAELEHYMKEVAERYADRISPIEVTNEMLHGKGKGITPFYDEPDYVEWCFRTAKKYFPHNELIINDGLWTQLDEYRAYIAENLQKGAPIDTVGIQFHAMWPIERYYENAVRLYDPAFQKKQLDLFEQLNRALEISEVTIPAFSNEPEDEAIQAALIRYLYTVWFAQPRMKRIVYWNLVDGYAAFAPQGDMSCGENQYYGGLLRFDLSEKPAYTTLKHLIHEVWHTEETLVSDKNGEVSVRGFYGTYDITVNDRTKSLCLSKNGESSFTVQM